MAARWVVGHEDRYRCECGFSAWASKGRHDACPECGAPLEAREEVRQGTKRGFIRRRDAERFLRDTLGAVEDGTYVVPSRMTVAAYLRDEWLPSRWPRGHGGRGHRGSVGIGTWYSYRDSLEAYVVPRLGHISLGELAPRDLSRLYDELEREGRRDGAGLSPKSVSNVHGILHKALADAVRRGLVLRNPADAVDAPRPNKPGTDWWSVEELRTFLSHVSDDDY